MVEKDLSLTPTEEPEMTPEQQEEFERLHDQGQLNATQIREKLGIAAISGSRNAQEQKEPSAALAKEEQRSPSTHVAKEQARARTMRGSTSQRERTVGDAGIGKAEILYGSINKKR